MPENGNDMPESVNDMTENGIDFEPEKPASLETVKNDQKNVDAGLSSNAAPGPSFEPPSYPRPVAQDSQESGSTRKEGITAPGDMPENKEQVKELKQNGSPGK